MSTLVDQFCPQTHEAQITAAAFDIYTNTTVTADLNGMVVVRRNGEPTPGFIFELNAAIEGAVALQEQGELLVVGDNSGTIGVYNIHNGETVFLEERAGARGRKRAFRGVAINRQGSRLAGISIDGLLRIWDLTTGERLFQWQGFSGSSIHFDSRGERILAIGNDGQPNLIDIFRSENRYLQPLQTPCEHVHFTRNGTHILAAGPGGFYLLEAGSGAISVGFATQSSSGIVDIALSPHGDKVATVTRRSVHVFNMPGLDISDSFQHGAPNPVNATIWDGMGVKVGGEDGLMHSRDSTAGVPPVDMVSGFGKRRISTHASLLAIWRENKRQSLIDVKGQIEHAIINRDGSVIALQVSNKPVSVIDGKSGKPLTPLDQKTTNAKAIHVGGPTVAVELNDGGCIWWHLTSGKAYQLPWPTGISISNGGDMLALITPQGKVRLIDCQTGKATLPAPEPIASSKIVQTAFVNKSPTLIVFDDEGVLSYYDLGESVKTRQPAIGKDIIQLGAPADKIWGVNLEGILLAALRIPEDDSCTILWVPLDGSSEPVAIENLDKRAWVDPIDGSIIEPCRSSGILERNASGEEQRVLRSLTYDQWISYGHNGLLDRSQNISASF